MKQQIGHVIKEIGDFRNSHKEMLDITNNITDSLQSSLDTTLDKYEITLTKVIENSKYNIMWQKNQKKFLEYNI